MKELKISKRDLIDSKRVFSCISYFNEGSVLIHKGIGTRGSMGECIYLEDRSLVYDVVSRGEEHPVFGRTLEAPEGCVFYFREGGKGNVRLVDLRIYKDETVLEILSCAYGVKDISVDHIRLNKVYSYTGRSRVFQFKGKCWEGVGYKPVGSGFNLRRFGMAKVTEVECLGETR